MFTGIIEEKGRVRKFVHRENLATLTIEARKVLPGTKVGDSVAVNGVCLTVSARRGKWLSFDLMRETLAVATFRDIKDGDFVNLERAMKTDSRFGGHFVTGHIDGIGLLSGITALPNYLEYEVKPPKSLLRYLVPKGSVCLDGVSLTVGKVKKGMFSVYLIPLTLNVTTLGDKKEGDHLNIETDILARYLLRNPEKICLSPGIRL